MFAAVMEIPGNVIRSVHYYTIMSRITTWDGSAGEDSSKCFSSLQMCMSQALCAKLSSWNVSEAFGFCSCIYKKEQAGKVSPFGPVVFSSFPSSGKFSSPTFICGYVGTWKPLHDTHTHTHIYTYFFHRILSTSVNLCVFFSQFLHLCLSLSLQFLSSPVQWTPSVQLANPSSVYQTTSFDTHTAKACLSAPALTGWGQAYPKVMWAYVSICGFEVQMCWFALSKVWIWGSNLSSSPSLRSKKSKIK